MQYSFIIPVYNCKKYLSECIASICAALTASCEILLIDDGSTDGSGELCDSLALKYSEIRVVHQTNSGASAARNRGIQEAQGERILFFDADDTVDSTALKTILSDPLCNQTDLTVFGMTFDYYRKGIRYRRDPLFFHQGGLLNKQDWGAAFWELYLQNAWSPLWNKVFKRSILIQHHLLLNNDMFLYEDFEFVLRYLRHCDSIRNVPMAIYHYRQAEDEGNAGRRLARISSLPKFLLPIEDALSELVQVNTSISKQQQDQVLQQLYLVLAREKITVSSLETIRRICQDFSQWALDRDLPLAASSFQRHLQQGHILTLYLCDKKTKLRHKIAVWVKSYLNRRLEEPDGSIHKGLP